MQRASNGSLRLTRVAVGEHTVHRDRPRSALLLPLYAESLGGEQQVVDSFSGISLEIGLNREVSEILDRAHNDLASLDSLERRRHWSILLSLFRRAESVFFRSEQGTLQAESWEGIREFLRSVLEGQGAQQFWEENSSSFNSRFRTFVDSELLERP